MATPTTFTVAVGATQQLDLVLKDAQGNPGTLVGDPTYANSAPAAVSITPNATGVLVTGLALTAPGVEVKITSTGIGAAGNTLTAESDGTVTLPLAVSMSLVPRAA